ncbi:MAG: hypothetical protein K2G60_00300 [Oscillospiraceae bacterium]|nr:hypothetical protein [Oscillospiraceae bacterium]
MADENKTPENETSVHDEMEELARIFREELGKAREEAEKAENEVEPATDIDVLNNGLEVEGYAVTMGEKSNTGSEEMCECCGERPRGTDRDPHSPFCKECAAIMEKYPYDWKGIIMLLASLAVMFVSLITIIEIIPIFSSTYRGNEAVKDKKLYTALSYYSEAEQYVVDNEIALEFKNLRRSEIILFNEFGVDEWVEKNFGNASILCALTLIENTYDVNNIQDKKISDIYKSLTGARASILMLGTHEGDENSKYEEIMAKFESLVGKKIYITDLKNMDTTTVHDELDKDYTPTGKETVITYDEGWIRFYQYLLAENNKKTDDMASALEKANKVSTDYEIYTAPFLVQRYLDSGEYAKAEDIIRRMGEKNSESVLYHELLSRLYRYRDKNYSAAKEVALTGLEKMAAAYNSYDLIAYAGSSLSMQKTLSLIMLKDYEGAYNSAEECCSYQNEFYGYTTAEARDLYAILALATGQTEKYDELAKEVASNVELYGEEYNFSSDVSDYKNNKISLEEIAMSGRYDRRLSD